MFFWLRMLNHSKIRTVKSPVRNLCPHIFLSKAKKLLRMNLLIFLRKPLEKNQAPLELLKTRIYNETSYSPLITEFCFSVTRILDLKQQIPTRCSLLGFAVTSAANLCSC